MIPPSVGAGDTVADVDIDQTDPMLTLPLGARAHLDATAHAFRLLEPATRP